MGSEDKWGQSKNSHRKVAGLLSLVFSRWQKGAGFIIAGVFQFATENKSGTFF